MIVIIAMFKSKTTVFVLIVIFESSFHRKMLKKSGNPPLPAKKPLMIDSWKSGSIMIIQKYLFWLLGSDLFKFVW